MTTTKIYVGLNFNFTELQNVKKKRGEKVSEDLVEFKGEIWQEIN